MSQTHVKTRGKVLIGLLVFGALMCLKVFWWDKRPRDVQKSASYGKQMIPDMPSPSLPSSAKMIPVPDKLSVASNGGTELEILEMNWSSQLGNTYAAYGSQTMQGSLFDRHKLMIKLTRRDDCNASRDEFIAFCKAYKADPSTPGKAVVYMASGTPNYLNQIATNSDIVALGPEYQPIVICSPGQSLGEDQAMGDKRFKNPQNLRGAVAIGVKLDGDLDLLLKYANDNGIDVNPDGDSYDSTALNFIYTQGDYLAAVEQYNANKPVELKVKVGGKLTGKTVQREIDIVATWTPGDVNVHNGRGGVTIISTGKYRSIMPAIMIVCKKWANDHRSSVVDYIRCIGQAGDQLKSYREVLQKTCILQKDVMNEHSFDFYKYFVGVDVNPDTHLGGSAVFNLADMANIFGIGENKQDIYRAIYNTFGKLQSKYYPNDLPKLQDYNKMVDKSFMMEAIANPESDGSGGEIISGTETQEDYASGSYTQQIGDIDYHVEFATASAELSSEMKMYINNSGMIDRLLTTVGTKITLIGHTDNTGSASTNKILSQQRAQSVKNYLISKGLTEDRFNEVEGMGPDQPVVPNTSAANMARNRRVELKLFSK